MKQLVAAAMMAAMLGGGGDVTQGAASRLADLARIPGVSATVRAAPVNFGWSGPVKSGGPVHFGWSGPAPSGGARFGW